VYERGALVACPVDHPFFHNLVSLSSCCTVDHEKGVLAAGPVDLDAYRPFFRELDLDVFNILTYDVLCITDVERGALATGPVDLDAYRPFFRELDLDVFNILTYDVLTVDDEPTYDPEKKDKDPK
jgi:hypothetical protein